MIRESNLKLIAESEREFQREVIKIAKSLGWYVYHALPGQGRNKHLTLFIGKRGFPDLVLCRPPRLLFVELKSGTGKLSTDQQEWLEALRACGVEVYVWRPWDLERVTAILSGETDAHS
jgi:hypothetical protein